MSRDEIRFYGDKYNSDGIEIIGKMEQTLSESVLDIENWHSQIANIILDPSSLYYFATNNFESDYYLDELNEDNIEDVKIALEVIIKSPDQFYETYLEKSDFSKKVEDAKNIIDLEVIIEESGIKKIKLDKKEDLKKAKVKLHRKLCLDYCFGVFGEMLFYNVVENIVCNKLVVSKVALITAPNTNAHGSDGIFCDENSKILYFGEAKFTVDLSKGITQAICSMEECMQRIKLDQNFMLTHKKDLKNGYGKIISGKNIKEYKNKIIIFLLHGNEITEKDILMIINDSKNNIKKKLGEIEFIIISFPIYDKESLKESIAKGVEDYDK